MKKIEGQSVKSFFNFFFFQLNQRNFHQSNLLDTMKQSPLPTDEEILMQVQAKG